MTERTAVPERVTRRVKTARQGGSGAQAVGDYVGQPAGEAAQAVRRAGLRPGLDRSFGCPAELVGLVVAQEPAAGSDMARNGMVTLYVAAPGSEPAEDDVASPHSVDSQGELRASESADAAPTVQARRRRKQRISQRAPAAVEPAPPPIIPAQAASEPTLASPAEPLGEWPPAIDAPAGALEDEPTVELEPAGEEFVVRVEDVLAGHSGPASWRGAYPRRRATLRGLGGRGRVRGWLGEHRVLAGVLAGTLALWLFVGALAATDGHHARARTPANAPAVRHRTPAPKRRAADPPSSLKTVARPTRPHIAQPPAPRPARPRRRYAPAPPRAHPRAPAAREAPPATTPAPTPAQQPSTAAAPRPSTPPAPERSGGGLFSP
jgi:hypothetical protein